jgi:hypothetical protein
MSSIVIKLEQSMEKAVIEKIKKIIGVKSVSKPIAEIDKVTLMSQDNLAEEWNSPEDQRWDKLL